MAENGTLAFVSEFPLCDVCKVNGNGETTVLAQYDGRTTSGQWAFMCPTHFTLHGVGVGLGRGQKLTIRNDVSHEKVTLSQDIRVTTPPCIHCERTTEVVLSAAEYNALILGDALLRDALPDRDADFRELVKSGVHRECWDEMFAKHFDR